MVSRAFITGLSGLTITPLERAFLREAQPWGLILFKRNISDPKQVADLTMDFRDTLGRAAPILIDQEGGRVQRLGPPHWPAYPPGAAFSALYDRNPASGLAAARLGAHLIAADPAQRYDGMAPFAADLDAWLAGRRTWRGGRRVALVAASALALTAALIALLRALA